MNQIVNIEVSKRYDKRTKKWVVRISGISSGFVVHGGDGDNMTVECEFDASRFEPFIKAVRA